MITLPATIMELEHRPLGDHFPLEGGPGQLPRLLEGGYVHF